MEDPELLRDTLRAGDVVMAAGGQMRVRSGSPPFLQCPPPPALSPGAEGCSWLPRALVNGPQSGFGRGPSPGSPLHTLFNWVTVSGQAGGHVPLLWLWPISVSPRTSCGFLSCGAYQLEPEQGSSSLECPLPHLQRPRAPGPRSWPPRLLALTH